MAEHGGGAGLHRRPAPIQPGGRDLRAEAHILQGRQVGQQIVGLEDKACLASQSGENGVVGME
jgi:hypothetical protein